MLSKEFCVKVEVLSDECVSTKLGVTENFVSSLYLLLLLLLLLLLIIIIIIIINGYGSAFSTVYAVNENEFETNKN